MKLYAVYPHGRISFIELVRLYKVKPSECVDMRRPEEYLGRDTSKLIPLRVCWSGNYIPPQHCKCGGIDTDGDGDCLKCHLAKKAKL